MRPRPRMCAGTASRPLGFRERAGRARARPPACPGWKRPPSACRCSAGPGVKSVVSGAITHTPDGVYLSGPAHGPRNYWMHCGASIGICQGAGAGKYLAQWMVHGQAEINMREFDPRRFGDWATKDYTPKRSSIADYHHMYYCYKPAEQHEVGRGLRDSSLHETAEGARARNSRRSSAGSGARWYDPARRGRALLVQALELVGGGEGRSAGGARARRPDGPLDLLQIRGQRAGRACLSRSHLRQPYSGAGRRHRARPSAQRERLHRERDHRHAPRRRSVSTCCRPPAAQHSRFRSAVLAQAAGTRSVTIADVTDAFGVLVLAGPRARDVLARLRGHRSVERRVPLADRQGGDGRGRRRRAAAARQLRRRTRLGAALPDGGHADGVRCPDGGGQAARTSRFSAPMR